MVPLARILEQTARRHHEAHEPAFVGASTSYTYREAAEPYRPADCVAG